MKYTILQLIIDSFYREMGQINLKKFLPNMMIISFLITSNFLIGSYMRVDTMEKIMWPTDDPIAISVARSYSENGDFKVQFLREVDFNHFDENVADAIRNNPSISNDYNAKGPIYGIFLGDFYKLLKTTPKDLYSHASIFSNISASVFLVIFFFFIKKNFNLKIAFFASILILLNPYFGWASSKVMSETGLFFIFSLLALFFLAKKKTHYFLFGIFTGLSHLTHPFGIFMGTAYAVYLLIHREFKGFLITILGWNLILLPWFVRNYYLYKNIGLGLQIPFSSNVSNFISLIPYLEKQTTVSNFGSPETIVSNVTSFEPFQTFIGLFINEGNDIWFVSFLLAFIFSITAFTFLQINKLQINQKIVLLGIVVSSYVLVYYSHNVYLEIIFSFIVPLILVYFLYRKNNTIFEIKLPRLYYFIIFYTFINLVFFYSTTTVLGRTIPELREVIFAVFMLTPLSLFGLDKFLQKIEFKIQNKLYKEKLPLGNSKYNLLRKIIVQTIIPFLIMGLILSPMMIQMIEGLEFNGSFLKQVYPVNNESVIETNDWINFNIHEQRIASNAPAYSYSTTGLDTVAIPSSKWSQMDVETFLIYYDISYVIFYDVNSAQIDNSLSEPMKKWPNLFITYSEVYRNANSHVIKITNNVTSSTIDEPLMYLEKGYLMELRGFKDNATKIYDQVLNLPTTPQEVRGDNQGALLIYTTARYIHQFTTISLESQIRLLVKLKQYDEALKSYDFLIQYLEDKMQNSPKDYPVFQQSLKDTLYGKAILLTNLREYEAAADSYLEAERINMFDKNAHQQRANLLEQSDDLDDALKEYQFLNHVEPSNQEFTQKISNLTAQINK